MVDYISREEAIKELREVYENEYPTASGDFDEYASHDVPNVLRNMKVADVQPVKHGRWIFRETPTFNNPFGSFNCSLCGFSADVKNYNFCPCCGAIMDLKDGDTNG